MNRAVLKIVKGVSAVLAVGVLALAALYLARRPEGPAPARPPAPHLPDKVASRAEKIRYLEHRDGRPFLEVLAAENVSTRDNRHHLKGVRAIYSGDADAPEPTLIEAEECLYAAEDQSVRFMGKVTVSRATGERLASRDVLLEKGGDRVSGTAPFTFEKPGVQGSGTGFKMDLKTRDLEILSTARVDYAPDAAQAPPRIAREGRIRFQSDRAELRDGEKTGQFTGNCRLESDLSYLQGQAMQVVGTPENRCREITATGGALCRRRENGKDLALSGASLRFGLAADGQTLESVSAAGGAGLGLEGASLRGDRIDVFARADGILDRLHAAGQVRYDGPAGEGSARGDDLTASFAAANALSRMEINGNAEVGRRDGKGESSVRATRLLFSFRPPAGGRPVLESSTASGKARVLFTGPDGSSVDGTCDTLTTRYDAAGRLPVSAEGQGACDFRTSRPAGGEKVQVRSDRIGFEFFPGLTEIRALSAAGNVRLTRARPGAPAEESESDTLRAEFSGEERGKIRALTQSGRFRYREKGRSARAGEARFEGDTLRLTGKPSVTTPEGSIRAAVFTLNEKLGTVTGQGGVEADRAPSTGGPRGFALPGGGRSGNGRAWIRSDTVLIEEKKGQAQFRGKCRMTQGEGTLTAETFTLREDGGFVAEGKATAVLPVRDEKGQGAVLRINSGRLSYLPAPRKLLLEGRVETRGAEGTLSADTLWGFLDEAGEVRTLYAKGSVRFDQPDRHAQGDATVYDVASGKVVLGGSPARVEDLREGRSTRGARLTFRRGDERVLIEPSGSVTLVE
ncbi:MAG: LPS export ABC transporter periplasmic protein LptC [Acidobacteria bacterium]|nr:LPS export ABC transporter periplasmic protein LptC [Acidobacteriota bacterium]